MIDITNTKLILLVIAYMRIGLVLLFSAIFFHVTIQNSFFAYAQTESGILDQQIPSEDNHLIDESEDSVLEIDASRRNEQQNDSYLRQPLDSNEVIGDFVVGPGRFDLQLEPGQTQVVEISIANRLGEGRWFRFEAEDIVGSDNPNETVQLLGDEEGPYSLRDFLSVPYQEFYLEHGYRARIPIKVSLPPDTQPGGLYGSLLASVTSQPTEVGEVSGSRPGSVIVTRIGTLFFITTPGDIIYNSELIDFSTRNRRHFFAESPNLFDLVVENYGSVHTNPYGHIIIRNILGTEVGRINIQPWYVMPQSVRTRELSWDRELLIGRYTATAQINRGYDDVIDELSFTFYVIPWKLVSSVFFVLLLFFLLLRYFFSRFELKRKV